MRVLPLIAATAAIASCTRPGVPQQSEFAEAVAGRVAQPARMCISTNEAENLRILDTQTVAYGFGPTIYINRLPAACPGISRFNTIIVEPGLPGRYCRNDQIRGLTPGTSIPGPSCILGDWIPYRRP